MLPSDIYCYWRGNICSWSAVCWSYPRDEPQSVGSLSFENLLDGKCFLGLLVDFSRVVRALRAKPRPDYSDGK